MIIFNDTIIVDEAINEKWLKWIQEVHIPAVMATGYFTSYQILTVIDSPNGGITYCLQYNAETMEKFNQFYANHFHQLHAVHNQLFEDHFVIFNTLMETIDSK